MLAAILHLLAFAVAPYYSSPEMPELKVIDLTNAVVVANPSGKVERKAVQMLVEEVARRTRVRLPVVSSVPNGTRPQIRIGVAGVGLAGAWRAPDGYFVNSFADRGEVIVAGHDPRG